jgi:ABC-type glycerol-3-phosphate transport system substrate-binding protein
MEKIYKNGYLMDGYDGADFTGAQALFFQGKAAMIHMGTWLVGEMADAVPADFEVGLFDFPSVEGGQGKQDSMFGGAFPWSVANPAKATSHKVNAPLGVEYLKRFTSKDANTQRALQTGAVSAVKGVPPPPRLPGVDKLLEAAANNEFIYFYWGIATNTPLTDVWWNASQALWLGKTDAAGMIKMLDDGIDKYRQLKAAGGTPTPTK